MDVLHVILQQRGRAAPVSLPGPPPQLPPHSSNGCPPRPSPRSWFTGRAAPWGPAGSSSGAGSPRPALQSRVRTEVRARDRPCPRPARTHSLGSPPRPAALAPLWTRAGSRSQCPEPVGSDGTTPGCGHRQSEARTSVCESPAGIRDCTGQESTAVPAILLPLAFQSQHPAVTANNVI